MENIAPSQNALLPIYTINTQSVVLHELVNEFCHIITGEREREREREGGVNYLLKAVWVQLCLVYYFNCHL